MICSDKDLSEFQKLLLDENIGGNAGIYVDEGTGERYSCADANFHAKSNGKIIKFTNDFSSVEDFDIGFRVLIDPKHPKGNLIVKTYIVDSRVIPQDLKKVIYGTVSLYNSRNDKSN